MAKRGRKRGVYGDLLGDKTAKMTELAEKTVKAGKKPGLYAIGSRKAMTIGIWTSRGVGDRVRKFQSDYKKGRKIGVLDQMGIRFQSDVEFQLLEECPEEIWKVRMKHWAEKAISSGYTIWNSWGEITGQGVRRDAGPGAPCQKVKEIMDNLGIPEGEMLGILETLERGLSETRGRG